MLYFDRKKQKINFMSNSKAKKALEAKTNVDNAAIPAGVKVVETSEEGAAENAAVVADTKPAKEPKGPGKIDQILKLHLEGKTNKEIQDAGFHPTTISIQISKYKKRALAAAEKGEEEVLKQGFTMEYVNGLNAAKKAKEDAKAAAAEATKAKAKATTPVAETAKSE